MFSVVIPLYNKEQSIQNTIQSVLNQSFQDFEIVIVNDGSTDSSASMVEAFTDLRIRLIHQENQGVSAARNKGIKEAKYEWIAFLDSDDLWKENHLEEIVQMMQIFPNEKVFVSSFEFSDGRNMYTHPRNSRIFKIENYFKEVLKEHLICTNIIVIHKQCFNEVGYFNEALNRGEDLDLWTRLARKFSIIKSSAITSVYRIEAENRSILSFDLKKSRIYHYDFDSSTSLEETQYYKEQIIKYLRGFIRKGNLQLFIKLKQKHKKHIKLIDIFK